jgi:UDP-N-acetylglucosamine 2-epimerase (non-hydrolysing)
MDKIHVLTILGTRPEVIRLSRIIPRLDEVFRHTLVHTGQNYDFELNEIFFNELKIRRPDYFLEASGSTPSQTIANVISKSDDLFSKLNPDALLVLGDTNSSLATIVAKRKKIPIFHMEAGNRCFDLRVPEEINRKIVDHLSDVNLTYSTIAREYLLREGFPPDQIIKTGSPMFEVLHYNKASIEASNVLDDLGLTKNKYFLISAHREELVDDPTKLMELIGLLNGMAKEYGLPIVVSTHPRTKNRLNLIDSQLSHLIMLHKPFGFFDYVKLQMHSKCVLSDSGTLTEEANILDLKALNLREMHERPEGFEEAAVMLVGLSLPNIKQAIQVLDQQTDVEVRKIKIVNDYNVNNVSEKIPRIILSYIDYVNRVVWKKY